MDENKATYYSGWKSKPVMLKFRFSLLKYAFHRDKFPLFSIFSSKGGIIKSSKLLRKLKICKFVRFNNEYYFSLTVPHWPSKAFDNMVAHGGLNIAAAGTPLKNQIDTVIIGITQKCNYKCSHCYEHFNLKDEDTLPLSILIKVIHQLQERGTSIITLSGGEPMLRYDAILEILKSADTSLSDFHIHTTGFGVTGEKAHALKKAGLQAAGIGLDDVNPKRNDTLRGFPGAHEQAERAIRYFQEAGIFTYVNTCLTKDLIRSGDIYNYFERLRSLNIGIVRWLEPKPCGAYLNKNAVDLLNEHDRETITNLYIKANSGDKYRNYPLIAYEAFAEAPENLGCMMGGNSLLYIDSVGNVEPCVFLPVTFGNILEEDFNGILNKMKTIIPHPLHVTCPSILLSQKIKALKESGNSLPIPFDHLKEEFATFKFQTSLPL